MAHGKPSSQAKILNGHSMICPRTRVRQPTCLHPKQDNWRRCKPLPKKSTNPFDRVFPVPTRARQSTGRPDSDFRAFRLWPFKCIERLDHPDLLPTDQIRLLSASSQNEGNDKRARYAIDGKSETIWHTQFSPRLEKHPHELILDLKKARLVTGVQYLARQDNGWNGTFGKAEFFLSNDREVFSDKPFVKTFSKKKKPQTFRFPNPIPARFLKIRILSETNGKEWASAAEIGVLVGR